MNKIKFTKMVASGNDFVVIDTKLNGNLSRCARLLCDRKFGVGADGLLLLDKSKQSMRIFNADGSEAQMCGNGARCVTLFNGKKEGSINTLAGVIKTQLSAQKAKVQLTCPKDIKLDIPLKVNGRLIKVNFVNTGVPHVVVFVQGLNNLDVQGIGKSIRNHARFSPAGTNVNFVEPKAKGLIQVRTYERGVEGETLACGTGSAASAVIFAIKKGINKLVKVKTKSGETLKIIFNRNNRRFNELWLEGTAKIVYKGEYYV